MNSKRIFTCLALAAMTCCAIQAQNVETDSIVLPTPATAPVVATTSAAPEKTETAKDEYNTDVWQSGKKYLYFSYGIQKLKSDYSNDKSDYTFALIKGRTYYLHKKPILGMIKIGLDWTQFDINFAKYPDLEESYTGSMYDDEDIDLGIMQLEAGMGIGPSVTVNPVGALKAGVYFHVTPSYSLMVQNDEFYHHYATFFNLGLTVSYKSIAAGIEHRWCSKIDYDGLTIDIDEIYDEGDIGSPIQNIGSKMRTSTFRVYIGFRW